MWAAGVCERVDANAIEHVWRVEWANTRMVLWLSVRFSLATSSPGRSGSQAANCSRRLAFWSVAASEDTLHERDDAASLRIRWAKRSEMKFCLN